jgi:hypothetical protein
MFSSFSFLGRFILSGRLRRMQEDGEARERRQAAAPRATSASIAPPVYL